MPEFDSEIKARFTGCSFLSLTQLSNQSHKSKLCFPHFKISSKRLKFELILVQPVAECVALLSNVVCQPTIFLVEVKRFSTRLPKQCLDCFEKKKEWKMQYCIRKTNEKGRALVFVRSFFLLAFSAHLIFSCTLNGFCTKNTHGKWHPAAQTDQRKQQQPGTNSFSHDFLQ